MACQGDSASVKGSDGLRWFEISVFQVSTPEVEGLEDEQPPRPGQMFLAFYGDDSYQWLARSKLKPLNNGEEWLAKLSNLSNKELHAALLAALNDL